MIKRYYILVLIFLCFLSSYAQNPHRFDADIEKFSKIVVPENQEVAIFTGSSSIRFWEDLASDCSQLYAVNTGFGGSQMSDLLYFIDETVLRFKSKKIFIYEGDNDIFAGKTPSEILATTKEVIEKIREALPDSEIYLISAKPSPSRWAFKKQYLKLNKKLKAYSRRNEDVSYIDVWSPMLSATERPEATIFISDSLHMNRKGYLIWKKEICQKL